jgi:DNA invertase Pin-like site-specific DNA recombinase
VEGDAWRDNRPGFQRLLAEVSMNHVGLVLGLELSRLARSSKDWHHLVDVCAVFNTLLGDQDGLYDPSDGNDRLLLGMKSSSS